MLKKAWLLIALLVSMVAISYIVHKILNHKKQNESTTNKVLIKVLPPKEALDFSSRRWHAVQVVKQYVAAHTTYSNSVALMADMKRHSGRNRLYAVSLPNNKVLLNGLVAHGVGSVTAVKDSLQFSNTVNSNCTSLGMYKIGFAYQGQFGKAYKLYGLQSSNSKAFERNVVLHSYSGVPYKEQPYKIMNSLGCPMVSPQFFHQLDSVLQLQKLPVLLYIFY